MNNSTQLAEVQGTKEQEKNQKLGHLVRCYFGESPEDKRDEWTYDLSSAIAEIAVSENPKLNKEIKYGRIDSLTDLSMFIDNLFSVLIKNDAQS